GELHYAERWFSASSTLWAWPSLRCGLVVVRSLRLLRPPAALNRAAIDQAYPTPPTPLRPRPSAAQPLRRLLSNPPIPYRRSAPSFTQRIKAGLSQGPHDAAVPNDTPAANAYLRRRLGGSAAGAFLYVCSYIAALGKVLLRFSVAARNEQPATKPKMRFMR